MSGNTLSERYMTLTPLIKTPLSDKFSLPLTNQRGYCGVFELQFYKCMEAFGAKLGRKYCDLEQRDFHECTSEEKQRKRADAIKAERRRQFLSGERSNLFEKDFPAPGVYEPDTFKREGNV